MKKIFFLLFLTFFPVFVSATVDYDVEQMLIDAQIKENGDLAVQELIVLDGSFHGYVRDLVYKNSRLTSNNPVNFSQDAIYNGTGLSNVTLQAKKVKKNVDFTTMQEEDFDGLIRSYYAEDAKNKNYVESSNQDGKSYKMYYEADYEKVAFFLSYTITDVVVLHNDVAELYWTFIGDGFENIEDVAIRITLPKEDNSDFLRFWAHGDLTGNIEKLNNQTIEATIRHLSEESPVDVRLTFNKNLVNENFITKKTEEQALPKILEIEEKRALEAEKTRERARLITGIMRVVCIIYISVLILWWVYVYVKFDKEYKSTFNAEYNREFIDDYNVEVVDVLMNHNVSSNAMSASILNLVYKKNIEVEEIQDSKKKKENKNYQFTLKNREGLNNTEEVLVDFLFEKVGHDNVFTTKDLNSYASSTKTYKNFNNSYHNWVGCVKKDAARENFYESNGLPVITSIFLLLISIFIAFASVYFNVGLVLPWVSLALSIVFFFYSAMIKKRTQKGNDDYVKWKAFKHFLEDFGTFDTKELPEIHLWERYLVYATVFGIADKVEKSMNVKISEMPEYSQTFYGPTWVDYHLTNSISRSIEHSIAANHTTYSRVASSNSSSGSGFGGGFSSGGGFGGGGGGGHGF